MIDVIVFDHGCRREKVDSLAGDLHGAKFIAEAVDEDAFALVDDAQDDGAALRIGEGSDQLRHGRGGRQHRLVFKQLRLGLAYAVEDVFRDIHGVIPGTV